MIRIDRSHIDDISRAIGLAMLTATTTTGSKISVPAIPQRDLDTASILAIQSVTMAVFGISDVAIPSDVWHFSNFMEDK